MPSVYQGQHLPDVHLVCALLQAEGIAAEVRGQELGTAIGLGSAVPGILPEVWVAGPAEAERAKPIVGRYTKGGGDEAAGSAWECPTCHEVHEPPFHACWKCGAPRPQPFGGSAELPPAEGSAG